jgi:hypothetical protein
MGRMDRSVQGSPGREPDVDTVVLPAVPPGPTVADRANRSGASTGTRPAISRGIVLGIAVLVLVQQAWLVLGWFSRFVSDDWALLWAAAESWGRLRPEQPNFWGQEYGSTLESIPTQMLHAVGLGYPLALPIVLTGAHLASWWIPAAAAWRRRHHFLAALAVAMPALLSTEYVVAASVYGTAAGRFLGGIVLAMVILFPDRLRWTAAAVAVSGCAFLVDTSSLLMTAPACAYGVVRCLPQARERGWRRSATTFLIALTPLGLWLAFVGWWYGEHPADNLHPTTPFAPSWDVLADNLENPARMLGPYSPELLRTPFFILVVVALLGVLVVRQRRIGPIVAFVTLILVTALVLSLGKTYDDLGSVYFQAARLLLPLPMGLWFVAVCLRPLPVSASWQQWTAVGLVAVLGLTAAWRVITWSDRGGALQAQAVAAGSQYPEMPVAQMDAECSRVRDAAVAAGTDIAIFDDRIPTYGCAALIGPAVTTLYPGYDRRRWVLEALDRPQDVATVLYVGSAPGLCQAETETCTAVAPGITTIALNGRSPLQMLHDMQIAVRPF